MDTTGNYIEFVIDTRDYSEVYMSFWARKQIPILIGPSALQIYYDNSFGRTKNGDDIDLDIPGWNEYNFGTLGYAQLDFTGKTNTEGTTTFRIKPVGAITNDIIMNFDMITFTGISCNPPPTLSKSFIPNQVNIYTGVADLSELEFTIRNTLDEPNHSQTLHNVTFTDNLPAGLKIYNSGAYIPSTTCPGATLSAPDGGSTIFFSFGTMDPGDICTASVYVYGTAVGAYENTTGPITSDESGPNSASTGYGFATLTVCGTVAAPTGASASVNPVCAGEATILSATVSDGTVDWYTGGCGPGIGHTLVGEGTTLTVYPFGTTTYYAQAKTDIGCLSTTCASVTVDVSMPPTDVDISPTNPVVCSGGTTTLTANATGATGYQWYLNGSSIDGATGSTYTTGTAGSVHGCSKQWLLVRSLRRRHPDCHQRSSGHCHRACRPDGVHRRFRDLFSDRIRRGTFL